MISASDIRTKEFGKATIGGYKTADVDIFLDEIAEDIESLYKLNDELERKIEVLAVKIEEYRGEESSIQTAVLNAQRLSDQIIKDANQIAEETISNANKQAFDAIDAANFKADNTISDAATKADSLTKSSRERADKILSDATNRTQGMIKSANESLARQHKLYYKIKGEVSKFRALLLAQYKNHLDIIDAIPDEVEMPAPYEKDLQSELSQYNFASIDNTDMEISAIEIVPIEAEPYIGDTLELKMSDSDDMDMFSDQLPTEPETALEKIKKGDEK